MKKFFVYLSVLLSFLVVVFIIISAAPYYLYNKALNNDVSYDWFQISNYRQELLKPSKPLKLKVVNDINSSLWQDFHLMDVVLPLPIRNPSYYVTTDLSYKAKKKKTLVGLVFYGTGEREISKIYFSENQYIPNVINNHKFFRLPIVREQLLKLEDGQVWQDLFTKDISAWNVKFSDMVYNLNLLELRSKILPSSMISFRLIEGTQTGVIEINGRNKDYKHELVLTRSRGFIYSYLLVTRIKNTQSWELRTRLLAEIKFRGGSEYLAPIIYREFKALAYKDKIDHTGMLYLLSAFSHDLNNRRFVEEIIQNLERGKQNEKQLKPLYQYASQRFGKTFASKIIKGVDIDDELKLKRALEIEELVERKKMSSIKPAQATSNRTTDDIFNEKLDDAKKSIKIKKDRMFIE